MRVLEKQSIIFKSHQQTVIKKLINFLFSTGFAQGSYLIVSTIIIRNFGENFYADIEIYNIVSQILFFIFGMNISASLIRYKTEITNKAEFNSFAGNNLAFGVFGTSMTFFFLFALKGIIPQLLPSLKGIIFLLPLSFLFFYLNQWILNYNISLSYDIKHRNYQFFIGLAKVVAIISLVLFIDSPSPKQKIYFEIIILAIIIAAYFARNRIHFEPKTFIRDTKKSLTFTTPLIAYLFFNNLLNYSDQLFISRLFDKSEVAVYSVGYRLASIFILFNVSISNYFSIHFYENFKDRMKYIQKTKTLIFLNAGFTVILLIIGNSLIKLYTGWDDFQVNRTNEILKLTAVGYYIFSFYLIYSRHLFHLSKTFKISILIVIAALFNMALNYYGLKDNGIVFASYTTLISFSLLTIISILLYTKEDKLFAISITKHFILSLLMILIVFYTL